MARKSMSQTKREEDKVAENATNKRKWEGNHNGSLIQQNKGHKVPRAYTTRPINKKAYVGSLPLSDVIIGIDWLSMYHAMIVYAKKIVHIPWGEKTLIVNGDRSNQGNETPRAPYRLAHSEMKELSEQLQELFDEGFIRPSSSPLVSFVLVDRKRLVNSKVHRLSELTSYLRSRLTQLRVREEREIQRRHSELKYGHYEFQLCHSV
ncbi:hypothetical protein Tco_0477304 [Tanacetum coccineum]